jgi:hypothetical protein
MSTTVNLVTWYYLIMKPDDEVVVHVQIKFFKIAYFWTKFLHHIALPVQKGVCLQIIQQI